MNYSLRPYYLVLILLFLCKFIYSQGGSTGGTASDRPPYFQNGDQSLIEYLENNVRIDLSRNYVRDQYQRVAVRLLIDKDGRLVSFTAVESNDSQILFPLEQAFRHMPDWTPARSEGKAVQSFVHLNFTYLITANQFTVVNISSNFQQTHKEGNKLVKILTVAAIIGGLILIQVLL